MENGFANDMSAATFLPELTNTNALGYLSIIIFNFMGFEVICTMTDDMADPARDIPKAIIVGGLSIAVIYFSLALASALLCRPIPSIPTTA